MKVSMTLKEWKEGMERVERMIQAIGMRNNVSIKANRFLAIARIQLLDLKYTNITK